MKKLNLVLLKCVPEGQINDDMNKSALVQVIAQGTEQATGHYLNQ